ncbi:hypothetical protein C351_02121 [Cryptococcus neoformans c8]|nr:hypothetical protein C353_02531 [Cryptococcus neoformans var. grubii AD1-83a]OXG62249.1 hypothetical protein C354_02467 [Cryptococcus neoformans var. grubii MW-RSA1955]OXG65685.1 hypothetical protein C351_02121 [Cryptococcus neoformans var. grubii c8]OXG67386.1 hypothetical protein C352_02474 [Cryptococcus neoformans var. grubii CHC193]OXH13405.1 hypothetical protein C369_02513 [Cryptococcus neoformans var. grubii A5-35-17]OXH14404.1 hypothetical protein C370_02525 [Cryptococcus neoformans 
MENSWAALAALGILIQLSVQRKVLRTVWLLLNVIDTFRALRLVRANGRRIGVNTRRKSMRDALVCWIIYLIGTTLSPLSSTLLGWIPLYSPVKSVLGCCFLIMRLSCSVAIFKSLIPLVKPYETPIDTTVHLFESLSILVFHFGVQVPIAHAATWIKSVSKINFKLPIKILQQWRRKISSSFSSTVSLRTAIRRVSNSKNTTSQIVTLPTPPRSAPSSPAATQTSPAQPSTRPRQPRQPKRKPLQPIIISPTPSPPPSPPPAPMLVISPSTPVRRMIVEEPAVFRKNGFLDVGREVEVRRSPRRNKGRRKDDAAEAQREREKAMKVEDVSQRVTSKKRVREEDQQLQSRTAKSIAISHTMEIPGMRKRPVKQAEIQPSKSRIKEPVSGLKKGATMSNVSDSHTGRDMEHGEITVRKPKHPHLAPSRSAASLLEQNISSEASRPKFTDKAPLQQPTTVPIAPMRTRKPQTLTFSTSTRRMQKSAPNGVAEPEKPLISAAGRARAAKAKAKALTREEEDRKGAGGKRKAAGGGQREGAGKRARVM